MGRYRTGLIIAAPDFDTYHCLERFARHPNRVNAMGMEALLYRTGLRLVYEVGSAYKESDVEFSDRVLHMRVGVFPGSETDTPLSKKDIHSMTDAERMALYVEACRSAGFDITEDMLSGGGKRGEQANRG